MALLLIISELILRIFYGFCDSVLMMEDANYEYIAQPNQCRKRFGNTILYNTYSMRNKPLNPKAIKILGFGDSVINGGSLTDQDSLATSLLSDSLTKYINQTVQFLNISAGSWGPDNCFGYLKKNSGFDSKNIFLFVNSHDAYDNMNFEKTIGVNKNFPDKQYKVAIYELLDRYVLPKLLPQKNTQNTNDLGINKRKTTSVFNTGFQDFLNYCQSNHLNLVIYLHAEKSELAAKKYNSQGEEIIKFCSDHDVALIKELSYSLDKACYRDNIHFTNKGQKEIADIIFKYIKDKGLNF
jgi:lysophospholipase L1-like esterase